jgi:hypothetical protein
MCRSWSVPALLALATLGGYAAGARPVGAQSEEPLIRVGDSVLVFYNEGRGHPCQVVAIQGSFLRCAPDPIVRPRQQDWLNLATATGFRRPEKSQ